MPDQPTTDTTWITESDLALLITIADLAQEFALNWGLLGTNIAEQAGEFLDDVADELIPLLQQYNERFPQTPVDEPIPYTIPDNLFKPQSISVGALSIGAIN